MLTVGLAHVPGREGGKVGIGTFQMCASDYKVERVQVREMFLFCWSARNRSTFLVPWATEMKTPLPGLKRKGERTAASGSEREEERGERAR